MRLPFPSFLSFGFKIFSSDPDYRHPLSAFAYGLNKHDFFRASEKEERDDGRN